MHKYFILVFTLVFHFFVLAKPNKNIVLIYQGPGSCEDGCSAAASEIPASLGYQIKYVTPNDISPRVFENAILWIQPGGNAIDAAKAIGKKRLQFIRNFIWNGGGYVGFCAGAFLADKTVDDNGRVEGLGIIPVITFDEPIDSNNGMGAMTWINWNGILRHLFFNGGAGFDVDENNLNVSIIGRFSDDGSVSTIQSHFGRGNVVVTGAHPEATFAWKSEGALQDHDGSDQDLAQDMVKRAILTDGI
jgi:glutamine amidotransferase-like uncharacterized protein